MTLDDAMGIAERAIDARLTAALDALAWQLIAAGINPNDRGSYGAPAPPSEHGVTWARLTFDDVIARQREHDRAWRAATLAELRETLTRAIG
jgi:hypothetical protein